MAEVLSKGSAFLSCGRRSSSLHPMAKRPLIERVIFPSPLINNVFFGKRLVAGSQKGNKLQNRTHHVLPVNMTLTILKAMRWWEKGVQLNMKEISSAQDLVDSLLNAGDKLVAVDFFSPGCAGCRALHPKICQFAERNPDVLFLQVNYEEHKSMCYSLNVHVLPFFRFYRGAHGRLCSFSCTNSTIKKFKDALAKHNTERCCIGPPMGLDESELLALAANKDLCFNYTKKKQEAVPTAPEIKEPVPQRRELTLSPIPLARQDSDDTALAAARR